MINNVVLVGRLGNDPELKTTQSGTALCKFRLAVQRPPRRGEDDGEKAEQITDWISIVTWGRTAESVEQYLAKGSLVGLEGRIESSTWTKDDGTKGYGTEVNAQRIRFLDSRKDREERDARREEPATEAPADDVDDEDDVDPWGDD